MNDRLRQEFLDETIRNLEILRAELQTRSSEKLSDDFLRRFFRRLHTVKGTSQTFGLNNLSRLAHEIENLLQAISGKLIQQNSVSSEVLTESLNYLLDFCRNDKQAIPADFLDKLNRLIPAENRNNSNLILENKIPKSLLEKLSAQETDCLKAEIGRGKSFYLIEVSFDFKRFNQDFINFRQMLGESGDVIAVAPNEKINAAKEIGFQVFYTTDLESSKVNRMVAPFAAEIDFESDSANDYSDNLKGMLENLIADGRKKAQILEKQVSFEVSNQADNISRQNLNLITQTLLHLLRNAVDHAIESPAERIAQKKSVEGRIKISLLQTDNNLILRVEDDGRGIDAEKIKARAKEREIIANYEILDKKQAIDLIFTHGFSTSETVSEISGRGIGLDAVKDLIEKADGEIEVRTEINRGTIFEIKLPS